MDDGVNVFSIKDLENFSGIKAHTIRIWEKRYKILEPERTDSNIRTYSEAELKKILNIAYLNRNGLKISKIARLDEDELTQHVMDTSSKHETLTEEFQPGKILMSAIRFNETLFKESLLPFIQKKGIEETYCSYLFPLLGKARILWQVGSLSRAQEQFVRNTIKQIIILADNEIKTSKNKKKATVAMINTADNLNDNNFLFYKYVLRKRGFDVIFTGGILPSSEVAEIHKIKSFEYLIINSNTFDFDEMKTSFYKGLAKSLKLRKIIFADIPEGYSPPVHDPLLTVSDPRHYIRIIDSLH
jgi:MerR family transcriptional regulator, light-induced transcriptional regulator